MAAFWMNAHQSLTVLKTPLVLTLLMVLSVSVHQTSLEMVEQVELDAMVSYFREIVIIAAYQCSHLGMLIIATWS